MSDINHVEGNSSDGNIAAKAEGSENSVGSSDTKGLSLEQVEEMLKGKLDETNRKWQSRLDQIIAEKKEVGQKAATVEERIAQIEHERQAERVEWARKEARAKSGIDEDLEMAVRDYAANDPDKISSGAAKIAEIWKAKEKTYQDKIAELENKLQFGAKPPQGGSRIPTTKLVELQKQYVELNNIGRGAEAMSVLLQIQEEERKLTNG